MLRIIVFCGLLSSCASLQSRPVGWSELGPHMSKHRIELSGVVDSTASALYLCPTLRVPSSFGGCVDLVASPSIESELRAKREICTTVSGAFTSFQDGTIGIGNFRSDIGFIQAAHVAPCHER